MNMLKYFDKDGNTKKELKKRHKLIIVLKYLFAKDKNWELILNTSDEYLEFSILPTTINLLPYVLFLLIEWGLYFLSGGLLIYAITQIAINFSHIPWYILLGENIFRIVLAISSFILSRGFIRFLKIDCKHSNDKQLNKKKSGFCDFEMRQNYDMDALERALGGKRNPPKTAAEDETIRAKMEALKERIAGE